MAGSSGVLQSKQIQPQGLPDPNRPAIRVGVVGCRSCPFSTAGQVMGGAGVVLCCSVLDQQSVRYAPLGPPHEGRIKPCPLLVLGPILVAAYNPPKEEQSRIIKP